MAYYSPQLTGLQTLTRQTKAPRDWRGFVNLYSRAEQARQIEPPTARFRQPPPRPAPNPPPSPQPSPQPVTNQTPPIAPVTQSLIASSPYGYSGNVYQLKLPQGATSPSGSITFPGIREQGNGWAKYEDGGVVYYNTPQWAKAAAYRPPEGLGDLWQAIPDSWKVNLGNIPVQFTDAILQAIALGNNAQAADIYGAAGDYMRAVAEGQPPPQMPTVEQLQPAYYVPGTMR